MGDLGCAPRPGRITDDGGAIRQVRGYLTADLRAAADGYVASAQPLTDHQNVGDDPEQRELRM
jgi:hypothetical protein